MDEVQHRKALHLIHLRIGLYFAHGRHSLERMFGMAHKLKNQTKFETEKNRLKPDHRAHVEKAQKAFDKGGVRALARQTIANGHAMLVKQSDKVEAASDAELPQVVKSITDEWKAAIDFITSDATQIEG